TLLAGVLQDWLDIFMESWRGESGHRRQKNSDAQFHDFGPRLRSGKNGKSQDILNRNKEAAASYGRRSSEKQNYRSAGPPVGFCWRGGRIRSIGLVLNDTATSKNPNIISSQLCSPKRISFFGSGLNALFGELS